MDLLYRSRASWERLYLTFTAKTEPIQESKEISMQAVMETELQSKLQVKVHRRRFYRRESHPLRR
jgi:hypothetical protein